MPRTDMVFIERHKTLRQFMSLALRSGFSRIPVIGDDLDDVIGVAYLKDVTKRIFDNREAETTERIESVMRSAFFVPDSKPADELMRDMQARRTHVAIVVDEYGGTAGLVTIEDLLEEIVGEITDEYDVDPDEVEQLAAGGVRVSARFPIDDLAELFRVPIDDEDVETVGGLMAKHLGRVPIPGAEVVFGGLRFRAESPAGRRNKVVTVVVTPDLPADHADHPQLGGEPAGGPVRGAPSGRRLARCRRPTRRPRHVRRSAAASPASSAGPTRASRPSPTPWSAARSPSPRRSRRRPGTPSAGSSTAPTRSSSWWTRPDCTSPEPCSASDSTTWCGAPGPRSTSSSCACPRVTRSGPGDRFLVDEVAESDEDAQARGGNEDRPRRPGATDGAPDPGAGARVRLRFTWEEIVPVSAVTGDRVDLLRDILLERLPEGPPLYPDGDLTDEPELILVAELIREAALEGVRDELPHSLAVVVEEMVPRADRRPDRPLLDVRADLYCERDSQKGIIIGHRGERLKRVGSNARVQIEALLGTPIYLDLHVKVAKDWQRDPKQLRRLGF